LEIDLQKKYEFDIMELIKLGLVVLAMFSAVLILRSLLKKLKEKEVVPIVKEARFEEELPQIEKLMIEKPIIKPREIRPPPIIEIPEPEQTESELKQIEIKKRVSEYIIDKPQEAMNLVKLWLLEDEGR
jgi:flagellar biosynthesis/type III secretory pathway M-ring protein FliF/YscJ